MRPIGPGWTRGPGRAFRASAVEDIDVAIVVDILASVRVAILVQVPARESLAVGYVNKAVPVDVLPWLSEATLIDIPAGQSFARRTFLSWRAIHSILALAVVDVPDFVPVHILVFVEDTVPVEVPAMEPAVEHIDLSITVEVLGVGASHTIAVQVPARIRIDGDRTNAGFVAGRP